MHPNIESDSPIYSPKECPPEACSSGACNWHRRFFGQEAGVAPESLEAIRCAARELETSPDLARSLLEAYRRLRPEGLLIVDFPPSPSPEQGRGKEQKTPLTTWIDIFAELLFPHLNAPRATADPGRGWYRLSPAILRGIVRTLFGERLAHVGRTPAAQAVFQQSEEPERLSFVWRKSGSLQSAFPWRVGGAWPELEVTQPKGAGCGLLLDIAPPWPAPEEDAPGRGAAMEFAGKERGLSVVMATRNAAALLPESLGALAAQAAPPLELVVQDGASSDGTVELLEAWGRGAAFPLRLESRPDQGVYEAWNRALARVRGEWVLFLGADDILMDKALALARPLLDGLHPAIVVAYGGLELCRDGVVADVWEPEPDEALARMRLAMGLPFPATFIRTSVFRTRRFDASYRIAGDYRLLAELVRPGNLARLPLRVTRMHLGGLSSSPKYHTLTEAERLRVRRELAFRV